MKREKINVIQDQEKPIERNVLAAAIVEISKAAKALSRGGLTNEAVVILVQHGCKSSNKYGTKPGLAEVRSVMNSLSELSNRFTQPKREEG